MITNISLLFDFLVIIIIAIVLLLAIITFGLPLIRMSSDLFNSDKTNNNEKRDKNMKYNDRKRLRALIDQYIDARTYYDNRIKVLTEELGEE